MAEYTNEEIKTALKKYIECAENAKIAVDTGGLLVMSLLEGAYDLINRQEAEIERLTVNMNAFGLGMKREAERADTAKSEAIKEFADRLKLKRYWDIDLPDYVFVDDIDNLVKEMAGESK